MKLKFEHLLLAALFCLITNLTFAQGADGFLDFKFVNHNVTIPADPSMDLGTGDFTLEAWIKASPNNALVPQIMSKRNNGNNGFLFGLYSNGKLYCRLANKDIPNNPGSLPASSPNLKDNKFHHVAAVRENSYVTYYVDGNAVAGPYYAPQNISAPTANLVIGRDKVVPLYTPFKGWMDDVRIWNEARTQSEIQNKKCNFKLALVPSIVGYWNFNEVDGTTVLDQSVHNNDGFLGGSGGSQPDRLSRYLEDIFPDNQLEVDTLTYEEFSNSDLWQNGTSVGTDCFDPDKYSTLTSATQREMYFIVAYPKLDYDKCGEKKATVIDVHGGGYANTDPNLANLNAAKTLARRGFVGVSINYRKGWDIAGADGLTLDQIVQNYETCEGDNNLNEPFTFMQVTYRMAQDVRAAHAKVISMGSQWGVNEDRVFYFGVSTGAYAVMHAAYGADNLPGYQKDATSGITLQSSLGGFDAMVMSGLSTNFPAPAGVVAGAGAIQNANWIGSNFDEAGTDLLLLHGMEDLAVPYCEGKIDNMDYSVNTTGGNLDHLDCDGSGKIYNHVSANTSNKAWLVSHESAGHEGGNALQQIVTVVAINLFYHEIIKNNAITNAAIRVNVLGQSTFETTSCCNGPNCFGNTYYTNKVAPSESAEVQPTNEWSVSPNPAASYINLTYTSTENEQVELSLYDLTGKKVMSQPATSTFGENTHRLDIEHLIPGMYLLQLDGSKQHLRRKVMVQR